MLLKEGEPPPDKERQGGGKVRDVNAVHTQPSLDIAAIGTAARRLTRVSRAAVRLGKVASLIIIGCRIRAVALAPAGGAANFSGDPSNLAF